MLLGFLANLRIETSLSVLLIGHKTCSRPISYA